MTNEVVRKQDGNEAKQEWMEGLKKVQYSDHDQRVDIAEKSGKKGGKKADGICRVFLFLF